MRRLASPAHPENLDTIASPAGTTIRLLVEIIREARKGAQTIAQVGSLLATAPPEARCPGEIVREMDSLAIQVRLLAVIAAREAARHGGGFEQAAAEVAALADRCAEALELARGL